jgi:hypothetical protein
MNFLRKPNSYGELSRFLRILSVKFAVLIIELCSHRRR